MNFSLHLVASNLDFYIDVCKILHLIFFWKKISIIRAHLGKLTPYSYHPICLSVSPSIHLSINLYPDNFFSLD